MTQAHIDSSVVVALTLEKGTASAMAERVRACDSLWASPLLEAEARAGFRREHRSVDGGWFGAIAWVHPHRPLSPEIQRVLDTGYLRGADCWHLATALYLAPHPADLAFLTLDVRQREVAAALGFVT